MRIICNLTSLVAVIVCIASCAGLRSGSFTSKTPLLYRVEPGPYAVKIADDIQLHDAQRDRDVPLKIYYPEEDGPFPIILFSHGAGDSKNSAPLLSYYWTSYGYVCIHPSHFEMQKENAASYSIFRMKKEFDSLREQGPLAWHSRVADLTLILNSFDALEQKVPAFANKLNVNRIGLAGHSLGAVTALLLGGARMVDATTAKSFSYKDNRIRPILVMSGPGVVSRDSIKESFSDITGPMMVLGGSMDPGGPGRPSPEWRMEPYEYASGSDKYRVFFKGANHLTYLGPLFFKDGQDWFDRWPKSRLFMRSRIFDCEAIVTLAFWEAHLKDRQDAVRFLKSDAIEANYPNVVTVDTK